MGLEGWNGLSKGGLRLYVNFKAYLECFVAPENIESLLANLNSHPSITYHAVDRKGQLKTNVPLDSPNAVTWGVFPGKEIVQPTIVETVSFMAWKVSI